MSTWSHKPPKAPADAVMGEPKSFAVGLQGLARIQGSALVDAQELRLRVDARHRSEIAALERRVSDLEAEVLNRDRRILELECFLADRSTSAKPDAAAVSTASILRLVSDVTGVGQAVIMSVDRSDPVAAARHMAIALIAEMRPDISLPAIGRLFGRDHTSILHAIRAVHERANGGRAHAGWSVVRERLGLPPHPPTVMRGQAWKQIPSKMSKTRKAA